MEFYLLKDGERAGPYKTFHVVEMLRAEEVDDTDLGWCSAQNEWMPLKEIPALQGLIGDPVEEEDDDEPEAETESPSRSARNKAINAAQPWMRYLARVIDTSIMFSICAFIAVVAGMAHPSAFSGYKPDRDILTVIGLWVFSAYAWVFIEAWFLSKYGTTLGKFLLSLKVVREDGSLMNYKEALRRSLTVCIRGYGLGIFPLREMLALMSFIALVQDGKTPWDEQQSLKVVHGGMKRSHWITFIVVAVSLWTLKSVAAYQIDPDFRDMLDTEVERASETGGDDSPGTI